MASFNEILKDKSFAEWSVRVGIKQNPANVKKSYKFFQDAKKKGYSMDDIVNMVVSDKPQGK